MIDVQALTTQWSQLWTPPERLPLSQWAEKHFHLSTQFATRNGLIKLYQFQKEIFDTFTDPRVNEITCMVAIQLVKTLFIQCALAYTIAEDPGPVLLVEPKESDAQQFSKKRLKPMLEASPVLRDIMAKDTNKDNTILSMEFPGGHYTAVSALVPGNLAGRTIKVLLCDETDKYPASADKAGDPISLAKGRTTNFGSQRKIIQTCSPTNKGESRIALAYDASDQRRPWVPCPHCGEFQILKFHGGVVWGDKLPVELRGPEDIVPGPTFYQCEHCNGYWDDVQRRKACEKLKWVAEKPFRGHAGFWISHLYSPWNTLEDLASDFLIAKRDTQTLKVFVTERLAELWKEDGTVPDDQLLYERREDYAFGEDAVLPERILFLVAATDVQRNPPRLETAVFGVGRDKEIWLVDYIVTQAFADDKARTPLPVTSPEVWKALDKRVLQRDYLHDCGRTMPIWLMSIDTGYEPACVYDFCKQHPQISYNAVGGYSVPSHRSVVPVRGDDDSHMTIKSISKEDAARKRQNIRIVSLGTHRIKSELYDKLAHNKPDPDGKPVPGCWHFPKVDRAYFQGLCSERRVVKANGKAEWVRFFTRNEPLDTAVYAIGAAALCGLDRMKEHHWRQLEAAVAPTGRPVVQPEPTETPSTPRIQSPAPAYQPQRRRVGRGFS